SLRYQITDRYWLVGRNQCREESGQKTVHAPKLTPLTPTPKGKTPSRCRSPEQRANRARSPWCPCPRGFQVRVSRVLAWSFCPVRMISYGPMWTELVKRPGKQRSIRRGSGNNLVALRAPLKSLTRFATFHSFACNGR